MTMGMHRRAVRFGMAVLVLAVGVGTMGCSDDEVDLPPLAECSTFLDRVDEETYPAAPAPAKAPLLRWDFSDDALHVFDYYQEVVMQVEMMMVDKNVENRTVGEGTILLQSAGDRMAMFEMKAMNLQMTSSVDGQNQTLPPMPETPPMRIPGVTEDGRMPGADSSTELLVRFLFPLPDKPLDVGQSADVPMSMPFGTTGGVLPVTGRMRITLDGYVTIDGQTCARLLTDTDISTIDVPKGMEGTYRCAIKGKGVLYFDLKRRSFVSGTLAMMMSIRAAMPLPEFMRERAEDSEIPDVMRMVADSDNLIRLKRNDEKAAAEKAKQAN
jgi:hypothetical protein